MATIVAEHLTKRYGAKTVVDDLSFEVQPGRVTGFLGPNGAGKSTTMRLMLGLDHGAGRTTFDGRPYGEIRHPLRKVGTLLEARSFHPSRTARNHLRMLAGATGVPDSRVDEVLALVGLTDVAGKRPKSFSLGMGQRLGLAAALLGDPHTLVLDEPSNGLDPQGIHWLRRLLQGFAAEGRSVLVSSHLLAEMALMADHLVVIGRGRLISAGPTADFIRSSTRAAITVRSPDGQRLAQLLTRQGATVVDGPDGSMTVTGLDAARVGELAFDAQVLLHELAPRIASLEEAFMHVTGDAQEFPANGSGSTR